MVPDRGGNRLGNRQGHPDGLSQGLIRDFALVWTEEGLEAARKVAKKSPEAFVLYCRLRAPQRDRPVYRLGHIGVAGAGRNKALESILGRVTRKNEKSLTARFEGLNRNIANDCAFLPPRGVCERSGDCDASQNRSSHDGFNIPLPQHDIFCAE